MKRPNFKLELEKLAQGNTWVIGCDEAGRGCLAGPIVAAAVVLDPERAKKRRGWYAELNDSKLLTPVKRFTLEKIVRAEAIAWGIGAVSAEMIDKINIHQANLLAMRKAVEAAHKKISHGTKFLYVDGRFIVPDLEGKIVAQEAVVGGDGKILSVAAASILAKTYRDRLMMRLAKKFPDYGFDGHKGYATKAHREVIKQYGISPMHRKTFVKLYV